MSRKLTTIEVEAHEKFQTVVAALDETDHAAHEAAKELLGLVKAAAAEGPDRGEA